MFFFFFFFVSIFFCFCKKKAAVDFPSFFFLSDQTSAFSRFRYFVLVVVFVFCVFFMFFLHSSFSSQEQLLFFFSFNLATLTSAFSLGQESGCIISVYCVLFDPMVVTVREMTWPERTNELTTKTIKENEKQTNKQTMRNKNNNNNDRKKGKHTRSQMKERKSNNSRTDVTEGECALPCGGRGGNFEWAAEGITKEVLLFKGLRAFGVKKVNLACFPLFSLVFRALVCYAFVSCPACLPVILLR